MAEEIESNAAKKRRIIHWNPDAGREQVRRRWTWKRILLWSVGGFVGLLLVAGVVIRVAKLVLGPDIFSPRAESVAGTPNVADANNAFISQAKAEQAHELTAKGLGELKKIPPDHPVQLQQLILMEKSFGEAEMLLRDHEFGRAFVIFQNLKGDIEAFSSNVKIKGE